MPGAIILMSGSKHDVFQMAQACFSTCSLRIFQKAARWVTPPKQKKRPDTEQLSSAQEIQGEEECGIPRENLLPIFHACLTINHDRIVLFKGFFLSAPRCLEQITGKIWPCDWKGRAVVGWHYTMNWLFWSSRWEEAHTLELLGWVYLVVNDVPDVKLPESIYSCESSELFQACTM